MNDVVFSEEETPAPAEIPVRTKFSSNQEAIKQLEEVLKHLDQNGCAGDIERALKIVEEYRGGNP